MKLGRRLAIALAIGLPAIAIAGVLAVSGPSFFDFSDDNPAASSSEACYDRPCYDRGGDMEDVDIDGPKEAVDPTDMASTSCDVIILNELPSYTEGLESLNGATATFAAGCFWGVEATFKRVQGVTETTVGYTGGTVPEPTYKMVCGHGTGHAEAVQVMYNPSVVSYEELLDVFWGVHDPTQLDRQGPDVGSQYRSVIFYHTEEQLEKAEESRASVEQSGRYSRPIVTRIEPAEQFWLAEDYHQDYYDNKRFPW